MTITKLIEQIERVGGKFIIANREISLAWPVSLNPKQQDAFRRLDTLARENYVLVCAELLERKASRAWEASGRDWQWWRTDQETAARTDHD
jgi:hypothetical protein